MAEKYKVLEEVDGLYRVIALDVLRRTPGVFFDNVPLDALPRINAIDRVIHEGAAISPGPVDDVQRPWYMHPHQDDNLVVLSGTRHVEIYTKQHGKIEEFLVEANRIMQGDRLVVEGPAMLVWPRYVFHRIQSGAEGSASLNFAVHYEGLDMRTNFNIYDLDVDSGEFKVIREGFRDQDQN